MDIIRYLISSYYCAKANTTEVHVANLTVIIAAELLVACGILNGEVIAAYRQARLDSQRRQYFRRGMVVAIKEFGASKYELYGVFKPLIHPQEAGVATG